MKGYAILAGGMTALALAACSTESARNETVVQNQTVATDAAPVAPAPALPANAAEPAPTASASATPAPDLAAGIPAALHGRWGLVPADCTSTRGDAKGLLTITADRLAFYESRGTIAQVVERDDNRLVADFAMTGEGQEWNRRMSLNVQDGGKTLIRREQGADAMPGPLKYSRCA